MAQPILWCQHAKKQRERVRVVNGKKVTEKVPQHGHDGKDADYDNPRLARGSRVWHAMDRAGNEVRAPITCAAADLNADSMYSRWMKAKFRHFGWIHISECPCTLLKSGVLTADHLVDQSLADEQPCEAGQYAPTAQNPDRRCPHYIKEREARRAQNVEEQKAMASAHQTEIAKLVKEHRDQTSQLVDVMRDGMKQIAEVVAQPQKRGKDTEK